MAKRCIIIGAGVAGLSASIRIRNQGFDVLVLEANEGPGGKLNTFSSEGFRFDLGPSLFTMPQFVEEIFTESRKDILDSFEYIRKDIVCQYFYEDGTRFTAFADKEKFAQEAENIFDVKKERVTKYLANSQRKYDLTSGIFLKRSLHKLSTYLTVETLRALVQAGGLGLSRSLHDLNENHFKDARIVQLFDRYATYNGSDPYRTPGIMSMIPHLEQHYGTFFPKGGMYSITQALFDLAKDLGVQFQFGKKVDRIVVERGEAIGVQVKDEVMEANVVVSNMDIVPTYRKLLPEQEAPERTLRQERSSSALIFYWGIQAEFPELDLHNIFFAKDYKSEFESIFHEHSISKDPTIYINISSKDEPSDAPEGQENWFVMVNAPGDDGQDWDLLIDQTREHILQKLERLLGKDIRSLIRMEHILDPRGIERNTSSFKGSLYGAASNDTLAAFLRHPNFSRKIKSLYFCGGSVHPGGGIPLCLLSGRIVAELIAKDLSS